MIRYLTREDVEAIAPGTYDLLPAQFRDRLPAEAHASGQNAGIFRATFAAVPDMVDELFAQLGYVEGNDWLMAKLVLAFYLMEAKIGPNGVLAAGTEIYSTMPWPPEVRSIADALRFTRVAYAGSHLNADEAVVGCWRVESEEAGRTVLVDDTPYPCHLNEGVIAGICAAFGRQLPRYELLDPAAAKRNGGRVTRYEVKFREVAPPSTRA